MTKAQIYGLCLVFWFCAVAAIASPAQNSFFTTLVNFDGTDGSFPAASLVQGNDGSLYGTTWDGGVNGNGTVFKVTPSGTLTTLHSFNGTDGSGPNGLVQASDGNFYATTRGGGAYGAGAVFNITPSGTLTVLYSFCAESGCPDGSTPYTLVQASDGNFYGITQWGGAGGSYCSGGGGWGCGTVFKITPTGVLTTLYSFCVSGGGCGDGAYPTALLATNGGFYGTTGAGGEDYCSGGCGTLFSMDSSGALSTLYSFCSRGPLDYPDQYDCPDGVGPGGLVQANDGSLYGVTNSGGDPGCEGNDFGCGTLFEFTDTLTTLHTFEGSDGAFPNGLIQASDGNVYGTTTNGGNDECPAGCGTVFKLARSGALTTLHSFDVTDGDHPGAALLQAHDGNLYGPTANGGANNDGTVFRLGVVRTCATCRP
ncbi:MAG: choice-of-anchor tandem repeat GloVer-containing protein [Candidatus Korobacteraceae bacterium]